MPSRSKHRLPTAVRPQSAELRFELDPRKPAFRGEARYALQLDRATRTLELHAADLAITRATARSDGRVAKARIELRPRDERVCLHFERPLAAGAVRLELAFRGRVRRDLRGLYRSTDRENPWLATQLCPTDARRFFPAFDEPALKLRYRIAATVPADQTVLSNAPVEFEEDAGRGRKTVHFAPTPPLSAYLIALLVGPFESSPALHVGPTPIRVHTLPGRQALASFAREAAAESLARLERWFETPHPYEKLDLVALPDFAFGAMENAGAVFFRDSVLLLDAAKASPAELRRSAETIAHELSHMWFGNLVTMAWWNDLWLNESFATWMAYEILDGWQPDWRVWHEFAHRREEALEQDALATSHPIAPPIRNAQEAHENFDAITYTKGASVLRMLERYLGSEVFREGVQLYLRRHHDRHATAADLWTALSEVSDQPIEKIIAPWTLQTGHPLVRVERDDGDGRDAIRLRQERFVAGAPTRRGEGRPASVRWPVPWVGRVGRGTDGNARAIRHLFSKARDGASGQGAALTWIYGNAGEAGFFRVQHGEAEWEDLLAALTSLSPLERIGLVGNQWALARAGREPLDKLLDLVASLGNDDDPDVLAAVERVLTRLLQRIAARLEPAIRARLQAWVAIYFGGPLDALGLAPRDGDDAITRERRARVIAIAGRIGAANVVRADCAARTRRALAGGPALAPELADECVRIAASQGDAVLHARFLAAARAADTPQSRRRMLLALADFPGETERAKSLAASDDAALAPAVDRAALLIALLAQPASAEATWRHLTRRWRRLEREWPPILLARVAAAASAALDPARTGEVVAFLRAHPLAAGPRTLRQIREELGHAAVYEPALGRQLARYLGRSTST